MVANCKWTYVVIVHKVEFSQHSQFKDKYRNKIYSTLNGDEATSSG